METKRVIAAALLGAAALAWPVNPVSAQCYSRDYFPLVFPFGVAAAIVDTAVSIATLPLAIVGIPPRAPAYAYYGGCAPSPYYAYPPPPPYGPGGPPYSGYGYYGPR